jgi:hypothetical protein
MPTNSYRPPSRDRIDANTDILGDNPQRIAREELIPRIAKKSANAANVAPHWMELFSRLRVGRRCSCFEVEDDASGACKICFATGVVGGYQKRGTALAILDVTSIGILMANVAIDFASVTRPRTYKLRDTAVYGELDWIVDMQSNVGMLDTFQVLKHAPKGSAVDVYVRTGAETAYVLATETEIVRRIHSSKLYFRVLFRRSTPKAPIPRLIGIRFSYKVMPSTAVRVDMPLQTYSMVLEEYGITNSFSSMQFFADNTVKSYTTEDFFYDTQQGGIWKIIEVNKNDPLGILTSWNLTCRIVQPFEPYRAVPLGKIPALEEGAFALRSRETEETMLKLGMLQVKGKHVQSGRMPTSFDQVNTRNTSNLTPGVSYTNPRTVSRK